ncbi:MAG: PilZ domain-containing protein [Bacteroidota bacterium]
MMTHHPHGTGTSRLLRSRQTDDRRQYHRFERHGLMARIGSVLHEVRDVSVGGIRIDALDAPVGTELAIVLFPRDGRQLGVSQSMTVRGEVVGHLKGATRIRFAAMSYALAKFLIQHLARRNGVEPYIFK